MKPTISFVLQLSPSTAYKNLEAVARNVLDGLDVLLTSGLVKCSVYMDGPTIKMLRKVAKPLAFGKIRNGISEGILEFLGGGYYDPMLPLFPEEAQSLQLDRHREILKKYFGIEPQGYFNSSFVWEMGMTAVLEKSGFDYALVSEAAVQATVGRSTPVSGWFTVEDKGSLMRIVPVADALTRAIENDDLRWRVIAESYCHGGKSAVVVLDLPPNPEEIVAFFERLVDFVETNDVQTWPVGYLINQLPPEGSLSYLMSSGKKLGLPASAVTCRETLVRRPEINLFQKTFLSLYRRGQATLEGKDFDDFCEALMPAMSPIFFRDLGNAEGMRCMNVRDWGFRYLTAASHLLDSKLSFDGLRMEVCDYLLQGRKQIWAGNNDIMFLLDYHAGGALRVFCHKDSEVNLLNAWRDDAEPSFGFLDCLLPNADLTASQIDQALSMREYLLKDPYEYRIKRIDSGAEIELLEEQGFTVGAKRGVFHVAKTFGLNTSSAELAVDYRIENSTYMDSRCFFGTIFEFGLLGEDSGKITIDGFDLKWDGKSPMVYPEASKLTIHDYGRKCVVTMKFGSPAAVFVGAIFGASSAAAPEMYQGVRVYPFWRTALTVAEEKKFKINISVSKG
ncbi:DUF1926 domain-containing protein [Fibrobacter sp. UWR2]|uniref:DUF1926 domain-containing protein n=1 Tax=Fibrobacter sp. UWR2 TaxID=1964352 RepID=UPI000B525AFD|nr:DUF1926 domain-containing protein [Fibrobacter sp. UWR2]OWU99545.1 glycoside hydrolase [Fibrobacter sp. UWR2]